MTTPDVNVVLMDFPEKGREMVVPNEDGSYTILINARISQEEQIKAYEHAMTHINECHFEHEDVQQIEAVAHKMSIPETAERIPADRFKERLKRLQKERAAIKEELEKKEREIAFLIESEPDPDDFFFRMAEWQWLYGGIE